MLTLGLIPIFGVNPISAEPPRATSALAGAGRKVGIRDGLSPLPSLHLSRGELSKRGKGGHEDLRELDLHSFQDIPIP